MHHLFAVFSLLYYCLGWDQVFNNTSHHFYTLCYDCLYSKYICSLFVIPAKYVVYLLHVLCVIYFVNKWHYRLQPSLIYTLVYTWLLLVKFYRSIYNVALQQKQAANCQPDSRLLWHHCGPLYSSLWIHKKLLYFVLTFAKLFWGETKIPFNTTSPGKVLSTQFKPVHRSFIIINY